MQNNLLKAHDLIQRIETSFNNTSKIQSYCTQLEDLIQYLQPTTSYHYMLFLAEIYATKLMDFNNAKAICKKVMQDKRNSVEFQGILRLSFVNALQHNYKQAVKNLHKADGLAQKKLQLSLIFSNYFKRLFSYSKDSNILNGSLCSTNQEYQKAIECFNMQLDSPGNLIQNKYYAAKSMQKILLNHPKKQLISINKKRCEQFFQEIDQQRQEQEGINELQQNYLNQRDYLNKIIELLLKHEQVLRKSKILQKNSQKFNAELQLKKYLAICKLTKVINTQSANLTESLYNQFNRCLQQLKSGQLENYNMINDFIAKDYKIVLRANQILLRLLKRSLQKIVGSFSQESMSPNRMKNKIKSNRQSFYGYNSLNNLPKFENSGSINNKSLGLTAIKEEKYGRQLQINHCLSQSYQQSNGQGQFPDFIGSYLEKVNQNSDGHQKRYFYIVKKQFEKGKLKLYYNAKKQKANSQNDSYYDMKNCTDFKEGKQTKALKRKQCEQFEQNQCFSITMEDNSHRNFYVPDKKDYPKWMFLFRRFQQLQNNKYKTQSAMSKKTQPTHSAQNMSATKMKKTVQFD